MANHSKALHRLSLWDEADCPEQPRHAPLPFSKPQLEEVFPAKGKVNSEPLIMLKNLQRERERYKKSRLNEVQSEETEEKGVLSIFTLQPSIQPVPPSRHLNLHAGSISDRLLSDASSSLALLTSFQIGSHLLPDKHTHSTAFRHHMRRESSPSVLSLETADDDKPRCCPVPVLGQHKGKATNTMMQSGAHRGEVRKQPSQLAGSKGKTDHQPLVCHGTSHPVFLDVAKEMKKPARAHSASRKSSFTSPTKSNTSSSSKALLEGRQSPYPQYKASEANKRTPVRPISSRK